MKKLILLLAMATMLTASAQNQINVRSSETEGQRWLQTHNLSNFEARKVNSISDVKKLPFRPESQPTGNEIGITNPEGTHYNISWAGHTFAVYQEVKFTGYCGEMVKSDDGKTVYFNNIMPDFQTYWLKGEVDEARKVVVIPNDQLIYQEGNQKYYFVAIPCELDDYGYATVPTPQDMLACTNSIEVPMLEDGGIDTTGYFFCLWAYASVNKNQDSDGYMSYSYSMVGTVISQPVEETPSGLEFKDYLFSETNISYGYDYADTYLYMGGVAIDGDNLYLKGICSESPESAVKLTIEGDKAKLTSDRILTDGRFYYTFDVFNNVHEVEREYNGYTWTELFYDLVEEVEFTITDDAIVIADGCGISTNFFGGNPLYPYWYVDVKFDRYAGNRPATPRDPEQLYAAGFWEYGFANVSFVFTCQDAETQQWINPRNCFYEVYVDDKPYTFTSDKYQLKEGDTEITKVPVLYDCNDFTGYNEFSLWQYEYIEFLFREPELDWYKMKVRIGYTDDNEETHYSNFCSYINPDSAIDNTTFDAVETQVDYFNLQGMQIAYPQSGQICIRISRMSDGTVKTDKVIIK